MSSWAYTSCMVLVAALGAALVWAVYRHEQATFTTRSEVPEKVLEAFFAMDEEADVFYLYELVKTPYGHTFRCTDGLSDQTMFEGSGRLADEAIREASWEAVRKALEE